MAALKVFGALALAASVAACFWFWGMRCVADDRLAQAGQAAAVLRSDRHAAERAVVAAAETARQVRSTRNETDRKLAGSGGADLDALLRLLEDDAAARSAGSAGIPDDPLP